MRAYWAKRLRVEPRFVTGDAALHKLRGVEDMKIVSPRDLWEMLQAGEK